MIITPNHLEVDGFTTEMNHFHMLMVLSMILLLIIIIAFRLKYLSNFWRTLEVPLINYETNFIPTWSKKCFIIDNPIPGHEPKFTITDVKLYVTVVTL